MSSQTLPAGFVYLETIIPNIKQDMKYASTDNIIGNILDGYEKPVCIITEVTAKVLAQIQQKLQQQNLGLLVYDCYRPQRAVTHMYRWSLDSKDQKTKPDFYPNINKKDFFKLGYIAEKSGHTRGSTVDLTIVDQQGASLDMGTPFDFMDPLSHIDNRDISDQQYQNRKLLGDLMQQHGFVGITEEWWHFTLKAEPFPDTYFDFSVS